MKITKTQIQKMIKEELEALDEIKPQFGKDVGGNVFAGGHVNTPEYEAKMKKEREEFERQYIAAEKRLATSEDKVDWDKYWKIVHGDPAEARRSAEYEKKLRNTHSGIMNDLRGLASDPDHSMEDAQEVKERAVEYLKRQQEGIKKHTLPNPKAILQNVRELYELALGKNIKSGGVVNLQLAIHAKNAANALMTYITIASEKAQGLRQPGASRKYDPGPDFDQRDYMEEDLGLTVEELQKIIEEEYENVTKGK
jgi:hypothetical protein